MELAFLFQIHVPWGLLAIVSNIYYLSYPNPTTGGDFVNIEHVLALQEMGFPAIMVVPPKSFDPQGLPPRTRSLHETVLAKDDYLVIPEQDPEIFAAVSRLVCNVVIHNQNSLYLFNAVASIRALEGGGFGTVISPSLGGANTLRLAGYKGSIDVITPGIPEYFRPLQKTLTIAYSPRKLALESSAAMTIFRSIYPECAHIPWCEISNMDRTQVATVLGGAAIYAAFSRNESIALSVLEAMQAGCIVVGDHGGAGYDYATDHNGLWAPVTDLVHFAHQIRRAVTLFEQDGEHNEVSRHGIETARRYSVDGFRKALADFWKVRCTPTSACA
jgi:glycosyltransferase involved in cell wall biosynthesis